MLLFTRSQQQMRNCAKFMNGESQKNFITIFQNMKTMMVFRIGRNYRSAVLLLETLATTLALLLRTSRCHFASLLLLLSYRYCHSNNDHRHSDRNTNNHDHTIKAVTKVKLARFFLQIGKRPSHCGAHTEEPAHCQVQRKTNWKDETMLFRQEK